MATPSNHHSEHPSTYVVQDRSNEEELKRLQIQDHLITTDMGGVLPEQPDPARFQRVLDVGCGTGDWLIEAAKTYPTMKLLVGVDVSRTFVELDPIIHPASFGLYSSIFNKRAAHIHSDQQLHRGIGLRRFYEPIAGSTPHIEHTLKASGIRLFWQHPPHMRRDQVVLDLQTLQLFFIGTILHNIGAGMLRMMI